MSRQKKPKKSQYTTVKITDDLATKLKVISASQGLTMGEYVDKATMAQIERDVDKVSEMLLKRASC